MFSLLIVSNKIDELLISSIESVSSLSPQILINISDNIKESLGNRKNRLINQAAYDWILLLDTDEVISARAVIEIREILKKSPSDIYAYEIPYQNYAFGKLIRYGGEKYTKTRLFKKKFGGVSSAPVHEEIIINGKIGTLKGVIYHNSYRSLVQIVQKFTKYAWQMAGEKYKAREKVTLKKLFLYGPHMVWARVIKDEGWRDGWRGILIALCFGYMENLMYWLLLYRYIMGVSTINEP